MARLADREGIIDFMSLKSKQIFLLRIINQLF